MSKDRFLQIWRNLHLNNNLNDHKDDKLYKIRPLLNALCGTFQSAFTPNGYFTIDESMVKWKGRLAWRQFMPNKPIRFGMKVWSLCDSVTGYMFNFQIYIGKVKGKPERNLSSRVVKDLLEPLNFSFAWVCFDNFYTGYELLQDLVGKNIYAWGTVRAGKKDLPKALMSGKLGKHDFKLAQRNRLLFCTWHDTKRVNFLSNFHSPSDMGVVSRRGAQVPVPKVIEDYQKYMGGVDLCDQNVSYYMASLKSKKWWRRLFFYFMQVSIFNTYIFAKHTNPNVKRKYPDQLNFIEALASSLIGDYKSAKNEMNVSHDLAPLPPTLPHVIKKIFSSRTVCVECKRNKPDKPSNCRVTQFGCVSCNVGVHLSCQSDHVQRVTGTGNC